MIRCLYILIAILSSNAVLGSEFDELVEAKLQKMTLDEKVGQLFIFGINGKTFRKKTQRLLQKHQPGGVILFGHNIGNVTQITKLTSQLYNFNKKFPMFVAVDQEGGTVSRIKIRPPFPSALAIGSTNNPRLAERIGYLTGETLNALGFTMNLAPVMDIADPTEKSFIGTRAFGGNPNRVADMAINYSRGLMVSGVLPTAKHFPGHGGTYLDSHKTLPVRNETFEHLNSVDLVPFKKFADLPGMSAMMVAHIAFPQLDASRQPASLSKPIMSGMLREKLGYKGLIITDDFDMQAVTGSQEDFFESVIHSLNAGADMIMIAWSKKRQRNAVKKVEEAIAQGRIEMSAIDEKVRRILKAKEEYLAYRSNYSTKEIATILNSSYIKDSFYEVLRTNLSNQRRSLHRFLNRSEIPQVISGSWSFTNSFSKAFSTRIPVLTIKKSTSLKELKSHWIRGRQSVFYVSGKKSAGLANALPASFKRQTLLISVTRPYEIKNPDQFAGVINLYTPHPNLGKLLAFEMQKNRKFVALLRAKKFLGNVIRTQKKPTANKQRASIPFHN